MLLPAGKYWIGDLCYVLTEDIGFDWSEFCEWIFDGDPSGRRQEGPCAYDNKLLSFHGTAWGDGEYFDQFGNAYGVDAGMIGCVRVEDIDIELVQSNYPSDFYLGFVHEFKEPFTTRYEKGKIIIGHVEIDTDPQEDTEEQR